MSLGFVSIGQSALIVGRTPWSAADALVGLPGRMMLIPLARSGSRGTRADQGSAPQFVQDSQSWENQVTLG
jgi:hypothetical protein